MKRKLLLAALCVVGAWGSHANADDVYKDVTSTYLTNADFEGEYSVYSNPSSDRAIYQPTGWTVTYTGGKEWDITSLNSSCLQWSQFSGKAQPTNGGNNVYWIRFNNSYKDQQLELSQTITLPLGTYRLSADYYKNGSGGDGYIFVNSTTKNNGANENVWHNLSIDFTSDGTSTTRIGHRTVHTNTYEKFLAYDNFVLQWNLTQSLASLISSATEVYNEDTSNTALKAAIDEAVTHTSSTDAEELETAYNTLAAAASLALKWKAWKDAKDAAQTAINNSDYDNVTGSERTALLTEIAKEEPSTAEGYDTARDALVTATSTFTAAKDAYDSYATEKAYAESLGVTVTTLAPTTAAAATEAIKSIKVEEYNYVTTQYPQDFSSTYLATPTTNTFGSLTAQHWSGEERSYFDFWNGSAATCELTYEITLPKGKYIIRAAGRGQANTASKVYLTDATSTVYFPMNGDVGLGINKDGVTSFDPSDATGFANNNNGRGWEWRYLLLDLNAETDVTLTLRGEVNNSWIGACDFALLTTADNSAINRAAYETALAAAEAVRDDAQYNNVVGSERTALTDAIATDVSAGTPAAYDAAKAALETATSTFTAAKSAYDAWAAVKDATYEALPYASAAKFTAIATAQDAGDATSAADASSKAAAVVSAYRQYVESNSIGEKYVSVSGYQDCTNLITNPDASDSTNGWTLEQGDGNASIGIRNNEPFTDGNGNSSYSYFDGGNYNGNDWTTRFTQTVTLEAGTYLLAVTARGSSGLRWFKLVAGSNQMDMQHINGDVNSGQFGRGWNDNVLLFDTEGGNVKIQVQANAQATQNWQSFTRFRLTRIASPVTKTSSDKLEGYKTFYNADYNYEVDDNTTIYKATSKNDESVTITAVDGKVIPAGTPVIVKTSNETDYTITFTPTTAGSDDNFDDNMLAAATGGETEKYILGYLPGDGNGLGFYKYEPGLDAGDVYLNATNAANVRLSIIADGEATAISSMKAEAGKATGATYNMAGQRVNAAYKGIVIKDGKKYMNK